MEQTNRPTQAQLAAKEEDDKAAAFDRWTQKRESKLLLSMIPKAPDEVVSVALRSAFDAGYSSGTAAIAAGLMEAMIGGLAKRERGQEP